MAETLSANITLLDANPRAAASREFQAGTVQTIVDTLETKTIEAVGDVLRLARIPARAILLSIKVAVDDLGTTGDLDIGFHKPTYEDSGAVLDVDAIEADMDVNAAATALTEKRFTTLGIETVRQPVWDLATLSALPDYADIDITMTATEATTAAGTVIIMVEFVVGN